MKKELLGKKELEIDDLEHSYPIHIGKKKKKKKELFVLERNQGCGYKII